MVGSMVGSNGRQYGRQCGSIICSYRRGCGGLVLKDWSCFVAGGIGGYGRVWEGMGGYGRVWEGMGGYGRVSESYPGKLLGIR